MIVSGATDWTNVDVIFNTLDKVRERIKQNRNQEMMDDKVAATGVVLVGGNGVALNRGQEAEGLTVMRVVDPAKKTAET